MFLQTLYKKTKKDQIQTWQIEIEDNRFRTHEGILNGAITVSEWTVCQGKSIGTKKETTPQEQALKEAQARWQKKVDKGHVTDISKVNDELPFFEPMLAHKFQDFEKDIAYPVYTQGKLDGIRCIARKDGLWSRNGKKIVSVPHIWEEIKVIFEKNPDLIFDGELYNHNLKDDFNKIISLVRKTKPTVEDLEESKKYAEYHIYDYFNPQFTALEFEERIEDIFDIFDSNDFKYIKAVDTFIEWNREDLDSNYTYLLEQGYEGQMIRAANTAYENKRSKALLKRKEFVDEEFVIVDVIEGTGNRSNMAGNLVIDLGDGRTQGTGIKGGYDFYRDLWINKEKYIGQKATIQYQNRTPDNYLRFPTCKSIRNYE